MVPVNDETIILTFRARKSARSGHALFSYYDDDAGSGQGEDWTL